VIEKDRDMARLSVNKSRDLCGVLWVYIDVVIMQVIMTEPRFSNSSAPWDKGIDNTSIRC
jgi:hypothetical protein